MHESEVDRIRRQTEALVQQLGEMRTALAQADVEDVTLIQDVYNRRIGVMWVELAPALSTEVDWPTLQAHVEQTAQLVAELHRAILSPRKSRLVTRLSQWESMWSRKSNVLWDRFVDGASTEEIGDLEEAFGTVEAITLEGEVLAGVLPRWVEHQMSELGQKEKTISVLASWLQDLAATLVAANELERFIRQVAGDIDSTELSVEKAIKERWLALHEQSIQALNAKQSDLDLGEQRASLAADWESVCQSAHALRLLLTALSSEEVALVTRHIAAQHEINGRTLQALAQSVEELIQHESRSTSVGARSTPLDTSPIPSIPDSLKHLIESRPQTIKPREAESLADYLQRLREADLALGHWCVSYDAARSSFVNEAVKLSELAARHGLVVDGERLLDMFHTAESLWELAVAHDELVRLTEWVRAQLRRGLTEEEADVFDQIISETADGRDTVAVVELADRVGVPDLAHSLMSLAMKKLIQLEARP